MLSMYRGGQQFAQIRDRFKELYPKETRLFTVEALRSMMFKILRVAIRRLSDQVFKNVRYNLPTLVKLEDQLVKNLINCSHCFQIRRMLIDLYRTQAGSRELLATLIEAINSYNSAGGGMKKSEGR